MRLRSTFFIGVISTFSALSQAAVYQYPFATYYNPTLTSPLSDGSPTFTLVQPAILVNQEWTSAALKGKYFPALNISNVWEIEPPVAAGAIAGETSEVAALVSIGTLNNPVEIQAVGTGATNGGVNLTATAPEPEQVEPDALMSAGEVVVSSDLGAPSLIGTGSNGWNYAGLSSGIGFVVDGSEVPEPSTLFYCLLGMLPMLLWAKRQQAHNR